MIKEFVMTRILGIIKVVIYLVIYFYGEKLLMTSVKPHELTYATLVVFHSVQWIAGFGVIVEVVEMVARINLYDKINELVEAVWRKIKRRFKF